MKTKFKRFFTAKKIKLCYFIWRTLSGKYVLFYSSRNLQHIKAPIAPDEYSWRGYKLKLWNWAVDYLLAQGELTYTPALRTKF